MANDHGDDGGSLAVYSSLRSRAQNYVAKRGVIGTVKDLARRGPFVVRAAVGMAVDQRFDNKYGVDTTGEVPASKLEFEGENADAGHLYDTPPAPSLRHILGRLDIDVTAFTFIDVGSGKGRALLVASEWPFKRILGVELSARLHEVASTNIKRWSNSAQRCFNVEVLREDAALMAIPEGPLVVYFFAPFEAALMRTVVQRYEDSYDAAPRPMQLIYLTDPVTHTFHGEALGLDGRWNLIEQFKLPFSPAMRYPLECRRFSIGSKP